MRSLLTLLLVCCLSASLAQGFNNDQPVDREDLLVLFKHNRLTPFKFYFSGNSDSAVNVIIEQYIDGRLVKTENFYELLKGVLSWSDEPGDWYFPPLNAREKPLVRLYFDENEKDSVRLTVSNGRISAEFPFYIQPGMMTQSRALDKIPEQLSGRQPLLVFYANKGTMISCPGNAAPQNVAKLYKMVLAVYAEPMKP